MARLYLGLAEQLPREADRLMTAVLGRNKRAQASRRTAWLRRGLLVCVHFRAEM